jgi:DNA-binding Lrp family transcriptional regulator
MSYRLDEIDRRIIYALMTDSRNTSAPMIADQVNVSPGTIRNRIDQLEDHGIIRCYTAGIDFEQADDHLTNLYVCTVPIPERTALSREVHSIPGVINVRELMTGRENVHILAVGENTEDLRRIARALSGLGIEIEDELLLESETHTPYAQFGPNDDVPASDPTDVVSLTGDAEVVDVTVQDDAPIVDTTLEEAVSEGILDERSLIIAIERGDSVITPNGRTSIQPDDIVSVLCRGGDTDHVLDAFIAEEVTPEG